MADEVKLIDRDEVGAKIQAMYIRREMDYGGENEFCRGMRKALRIIEDAPTIEAEPVKHGHWVNEGFLDMYCSNCGETPDSESGSCPMPTDFCPYCGARMNGGDE